VRATGVEEIVALKRLKMEKEREGFPITSLREINTLLKAQHPNIVTVRVSVLFTHHFSATSCGCCISVVVVVATDECDQVSWSVMLSVCTTTTNIISQFY